MKFIKPTLLFLLIFIFGCNKMEDKAIIKLNAEENELTLQSQNHKNLSAYDYEQAYTY